MTNQSQSIEALNAKAMRTAEEVSGMSMIADNLQTAELMKIAADFNAQRIELTEQERKHLVDLLKTRAAEELDYGQELECESVRVVRRVTGAVGVFFKS